MNRSTRAALRTLALAGCLLSMSVPGASQTSTPRLVLTTPPFVGQTLHLELDGALPGTSIQLLFSTEADSTATPFGQLELRRDAAVWMASGITTAAGTWSFAIPIPLATQLAETGAHFQAVVADPAAPGGNVLSAAVHARLLGPRVYAVYGSAGSAGMLAVSALTDAIVARVDCRVDHPDFGFPREGKPVFDAVFSRGAAMITDRDLLLFDPYFGATVARIPFNRACARTVFTNPSRTTVYVLELAGPSSPARVHALRLSTGTQIASLDLLNAAEPIWCQGRSGADVFVAEHEPGGRTAVRRIGLEPLVDRGSVAVGLAQSDNFRSYNGTQFVALPMLQVGGEVYISTSGSAGSSMLGSLTRIVPGPAGMTTLVTPLGTRLIHRLEAVPAADRLIGGIGATDVGPYFLPCEIPFGSIGQPTTLRPPQLSYEFYVHDIEPDGASAWIVADRTWDGQRSLFRLDVSTHAWTTYPYAWTYGPSDAEVVRDAWNHELWVSNVGVGPPVGILPEILIVDVLHGTSRTIPLDVTAAALQAVPLP